MGSFLALLTIVAGVASANAENNPNLSCESAHRKAVNSCAAHEHAVNADSLSIVSSETRERVVRSEETKLAGIKQSCMKLQQSCALSCDEAVESATLDGADITQPLERLTDCRQGEVQKHIEAMRKKINSLRRILSGPIKKPIKSASNR